MATKPKTQEDERSPMDRLVTTHIRQTDSVTQESRVTHVYPYIRIGLGTSPPVFIKHGRFYGSGGDSYDFSVFPGGVDKFIEHIRKSCTEKALNACKVFLDDLDSLAETYRNGPPIEEGAKEEGSPDPLADTMPEGGRVVAFTCPLCGEVVPKKTWGVHKGRHVKAGEWREEFDERLEPVIR